MMCSENMEAQDMRKTESHTWYVCMTSAINTNMGGTPKEEHMVIAYSILVSYSIDLHTTKQFLTLLQ